MMRRIIILMLCSVLIGGTVTSCAQQRKVKVKNASGVKRKRSISRSHKWPYSWTTGLDAMRVRNRVKTK